MRIIELEGIQPGPNPGLTPGSTAAALADRLATFDALKRLPRAEIEWLVSHGQYQAHEAGGVLLTPNDEANEMIVQVTGRTVVYFGQGGRRHSMETRAGSLSGLLPFSRLKRPFADVLVEEASELLMIHRQQFPEMMRECPVLTESLVHTMLDRARRFSAADWQDEKVMSLGRLAAGLAHELNNPASAAASGTKRLARALHDVGAAAYRVGMANLSAGQRATLVELVDRGGAAGHAAPLSAMDRGDRIERLADWLDEQALDVECAPALVDAGIEPAAITELGCQLRGDALAAAVAWIASTAAAALVAADVERATHRIHDVVSAVRDFSHLDRAAVREPTDIARGLADTIDVLSPKAHEKGATVALDAAPDLPRVFAVVADLNQVWSCLLENALDAVVPGGSVVIHATTADRTVVVEVVDDGPGVPPEIQSRIFDPFFTTKDVGKGTGLGLDIVRRTAHTYGGEVGFESRPGRTAFRVRLPAEALA